MACKGTRVTETEIDRMVELYEKCGSFKTVGKKLRRSPDTVSKYIAQRRVVKQVANFYQEYSK